MAGPAQPAAEAAAPAAAGGAPPAPEHVERDAGTLIQEQLDRLLLASFNALLDVSKASGAGAGAGAGGGASSSLPVPPQVAQAGQMGVAIGKMLRELEGMIEALPVLPPTEEEGVTSVETARRRLKALEGEYKLIHRELGEAVEEAGLLSARLRRAVSSSSAGSGGGGGGVGGGD